MLIEIKIVLTLVLMLGASCMIFARRYKNPGPENGVGIAGWVIFIILCMWWGVK